LKTGVDMTKLKYETFRHVEAELYTYHATLKEMNRLRSDIINATNSIDLMGIKNSWPGDPTGKTATILATHRLIQRMTEITDAIEEIYHELPVEKQKFIHIKYWDSPYSSFQQTSLELHKSIASIYRWRESIIYSISSKIGWK
jgi:RinA family phage transcriptional activator